MHLSAFLNLHSAVVHVRLTDVQGSSPREEGAQMFVATDAFHGTIGGGQLEYMAIDKARVMLRNRTLSETMDVPLGPEIGQCCGGRVALSLTLMTEADRAAACAQAAKQHARQPHVYLFGAGHVGRALARFFQHLPVHCTLIDTRAQELSLCDADVTKRLTALPEADITQAPARSAYIVATHDHALDFLLTSQALDRGCAAYVGLIGSATKRARFARFHADHSTTKDSQTLHCPIGANTTGDKRPEVIAAHVVAEVMACLAQPAPFARMGDTGQHHQTAPAFDCD